jgi:hypothetical protein
MRNTAQVRYSVRESNSRWLISRLFPAALRHIGNTTYPDDWRVSWLRQRRAAHEDVLRFYLERAAGAGFQSFTDAERAWALFGDRDALDRYLRSLDSNRLQDVIASLETTSSLNMPCQRRSSF